MSWKIQALVGERVCGSITRKMVLLNMASRANDDGTGVYASLPMIAGWCEVDARTVRRVVRDLEAEGLIIQCGWKTVKTGRINQWQVAVDAVEKLPLYRDDVATKREAKIAKSLRADTVSGVKKVKAKAMTCATRGGHEARPDTETARTQSPHTPDTGPASSILEPFSLSSEAKAPEERGAVVELRAGEGSQALALYTEAAKRSGWVVPKGQPNAKRKQAIKARLRECGGIPGWIEQIATAERQPFLGGNNDKGWRMDLDFFVRPSGWTGIAEEKYIRNKSPQTSNRNGPARGIYRNVYTG